MYWLALHLGGYSVSINRPDYGTAVGPFVSFNDACEWYDEHKAKRDAQIKSVAQASIDSSDKKSFSMRYFN